MIDYLRALLAYLFDQDKKAHSAPEKGRENLSQIISATKKKED